MKRFLKIFLFILTLFISIPLQNTYAETLEEYINNLVGPEQIYNTMLSPAYLKNNTAEEYVDPQSGELTIKQTDYSMKGRNGLDLNITRIYKSSMDSYATLKSSFYQGSYLIYCDEEDSSFYSKRYNIGINTRFSFPSLEIRNNQSDGSSYKFLHSESGDVYTLNGPTEVQGEMVYTLENHKIQDVSIKEDTGYNNGQSDGISKYVMLEKDGKKTYFSEDGRILSIIDRHDNKIVFEYSTIKITNYNEEKRLITKITDTLGRVVNFEYNEGIKNHDGSFTISLNGGNYDVSIYLPDGTPDSLSDNKKIVYHRESLLYDTYITKVYDTDDQIKYDIGWAQLSAGMISIEGVTKKNVDPANGYIESINHCKTNRTTAYSYKPYKKKLFDGYIDRYKVDVSNEIENISGTKNIKNSHTYSYTNGPDGILFTDKFNDFNLDDWDFYGGEWSITPTEALLYINAHYGDQNAIVKGSNYTNYSYSSYISVNDTNNSSAGLLFRVAERSSNLTGYYAQISTNTINLYKFRNNDFTLLGSHPIQIDNLGHFMKIDVQGDEIEVYLDDMVMPKISSRDYEYSSGSVGIRGCDAYFSNIILEKENLFAETFPSNDLYNLDTYGGTWGVEHGELSVDSGDGYKAVFDHKDFSNFTYEADVKVIDTTSDSDAGLIFGANYIATGVNSFAGYYAGISAADNKVVLEKRDFVNNNYSCSLLAEAPLTINPGTLYHVKVVVNGGSIKVFVNDTATPVITVNNLNIPNGSFGLRAYKTHSHFDNIQFFDNAFTYSCTKSNMAGATTKYTYNAANELINVDDSGSSHKEISTMFYDTNRLPQKKIIDSYNVVNGQPTGGYVRKVENFTYDNYGNLISYTDPSASRDSNDNPTDGEHTVTYTYATDKYHELTSKAWKKDASTISKIEYDVDSSGNVTQERRINTGDNVVIDYQHDTYGNMTQKKVHYASNTGNTYIVNYEYGIDADGVDQKGAYLTKEYSVLDGVEIAKKRTYDFYSGNIKSSIDENGNRSSYDYDSLFRVTKITNPDTTTKQYQYINNTSSNREIRYTDPNGGIFSYTYDIFGNLVKYSVNGVVQKKVEYDSNSNKTKEIDANGHATRFQYDSTNRLIGKSFWENDTTQKKTMSLGYTVGYNSSTPLLLTITDEEGYIKKNYYDIKNQLTRSDYTPDKTNFYAVIFGYDYVGNKTSTTDAKGNTTIYTYDSLNRLSSLKDALNNTTSYFYDAAGKTIETTNAKNVSIYSDYDSIGRLIRVKSPLPNSGQAITRYIYDKAGNKIKEIQPNNYSAALDTPTQAATMVGISYSYDNMNRLVSTLSPEGTVLEFRSYDANGNVKKVVDGLRYTGDISTSQGTTYTYDAFNRVIQASNALNYSASNIYDLVGNLTKQTDARGNAVDYEYNADRTLKKVTYPDGGTVEYTYDKLGRKLTQKDQLGNTTTNVYNGLGLISSTDSLGRSIKNYMDANGNIVKTEILRDTGVYDIAKYEYDNLNRVVKSKKLVDEGDIYNASSLPGIASIRDAEYPGKVQLITGYEYDAVGNKTKVIDPRAYGYNDIDTYSVKYSYDAANRPETVTQKLNGSNVYVQYYYDASGNKIKERSPSGYFTEYTYDNRNRLTAVKDALGKSFTYGYDILNNKISEKNAKEDTVTYTYDTLNRLQTVKDPDGVIISANVYDENGNVIKQIDAKGYQSASDDANRYGTVYVYDSMNRLTQVTDPMGGVTKIEYNTSGLKTKVTDALNNSTSFAYDLAGRLMTVTDQLGFTTQYTYNKAGSKLSMTDGRGKITLYVYGAFGIQILTTNPENLNTSYKYDLALNAAKVTDGNGNDTIYTYDGRNLLLSRTVVQTGDSISYTYDEAGNRKSMTDSTGTSNYSYNENNWLTSIVKDGVAQLSYSFDDIGNIASVTDKKGYVVSYTYDKSSRMSSVSYGGKSTTYTYDVNGNRQTISYNGGVKEEYTYDRNNKLLSLTNKKPDGSTISSYSYVYDAAGRQTSKTDSYGQTTYTYDADSRVTLVSAPGKTTVYTYDGASNRSAMSETYTSDQTEKLGEETITYKIKGSQYIYSDANKLLYLVESLKDSSGNELAQKTTSYIYDNNGNQIQQVVSWIKAPAAGAQEAINAVVVGKASTDTIDKVADITSNSYDGFNRLSKVEAVKQGEKTITEYKYNSDDLRVKKIVKKSTNNYTPEETNFLYDRGNVILETDAADNVKVRYIKGVNYIARIDNTGKLSYFLFNGHGDVVHTVTEAGVVENNYDYDIWGNPTLTVESYDCGIRYAGEYFDKETGLYYLRARYYNPYIGRFITEDSYWGEDENPLSLNRYTYGHNNPIMFIDPSGHAITEWDKDNLSVSELASLQTATDMWLEAYNSGDANAMAAAHAYAEEIRGSYRETNEIGSDSGYTYVTSDDGSGTSTLYNKDTTLYDVNASYSNDVDTGESTLNSVTLTVKTPDANTYVPEMVANTGDIIQANTLSKHAPIDTPITDDTDTSEDSSIGTWVGDVALPLTANDTKTLADAVKNNDHDKAMAVRNQYIKSTYIKGAIIALKEEGIIDSNLTFTQDICSNISEIELIYATAAMYIPQNYESSMLFVGGGETTSEKLELFYGEIVCFTEDTLIPTVEGHKPIKDIKIGDEVYSQNVETGEKGLKSVKNVFINESHALIHIKVGETEIKTTPTHPFWVDGKGWVQAGNLEQNDKLTLYSGEEVYITKIEKEQLEKPIKVYNFEVKDWHTYFVSEKDVLVHNKCSDKVESLKSQIVDLVGKDATFVKNKSGDIILENSSGTIKIRFDINNPSPHKNPHGHIETKKGKTWRGPGPIYPIDVDPE